MKRLPLILAVLIAIIYLCIIVCSSIIPLFIIYLLGGIKPFSILQNLIDNLTEVIFGKINSLP